MKTRLSKPVRKTEDPVKHPSHYTSSDSGIECIDVVEHMSFNLGNAVKYIWRSRLKGRFEEDILKAIWYLKRELRRHESVSNQTSKRDPEDRSTTSRRAR